MTLPEAITILRTHNEWRRGAEIEPTYPIILGEAIDTVLSVLSTPTDTARAEDDEHMTGIIECAKCEYIHTRKERVDVPINDTMNESRCPMCQSAQFYNEPKSDNELFAAKRRIKELESEAAPIRADVERVRWEKELVMRQLSAANQRIAEMEKQIESNKKALASNGTISGTGTARFSARTNSLRSMYSKRLPGIGK